MRNRFLHLIRVLLVTLCLSLGVCTLVLLSIGLWGGNGNIADLIAGQLPSSINLRDRAVSSHSASESYAVSVSVDSTIPVNVLPPEFLSFSIDVAQVVGSTWWNPAAVTTEGGSGNTKRIPFDFKRPRLDFLTKQLTPAYLRIGGSEADRLWYDIGQNTSAKKPEDPSYRAVLDASTWDAVCGFAQRCGLGIVFTLNAAAGFQNGSAHAEDLVRYTVAHRYPVILWEFGNELNGYWFVHGPATQQSPENYAQNYVNVVTRLRKIDPSARFSPQSSAFWPVIGEAFSPIFGFMPRALVGIGADIDVLSWHYYPQQSRRAPFATRRASPARMLEVSNLDEAAFWAGKMRDWRDHYAPGKPLWLGETGNAQFGGEPGVSDTYIGGLWWLDELGLMAREGMSVVVRQTLAGSNYGLLDETTLEPRPDYWNSWLWKHFMGSSVYHAVVLGTDPQGEAQSRKLRVYAHSSIRAGTISLLFINIDPDHNAHVSISLPPDKKALAWVVSAPDVFGKALMINGRQLELDLSGTMPGLTPQTCDGNLQLPPLTYAFVQY